jgi:Domain of unknown function (DUF4375)
MTSHRKPSSTPFTDRAVQEARRRQGSRADPRCLSIADQTIAAVYSAQGVIDNGGLEYFFGSDWPGQPPYSFFSGAYRRIGAEEAATCIDEAVRLFPFLNPEQHEEDRKQFIKGLPESHEFVVLSLRVCGDERVWKCLEEYARRQAGH